MRSLRVPSSLLAPRGDRPLSPAMVAAVWEIAAAVRAAELPAESDGAAWVSIQAARLRGEGGRSDNVWLRECLRRLSRVELAGERSSGPWGAVLLAEWRVTDGGSVVRLLIPPAGLAVLRAPGTFARLEADAVHRLPGHARRLYALLADKRRLSRRNSWRFELAELRRLLDVERPSYGRFNNLRQFVLEPAVAAINDFGTVRVRMTPERDGRSVVAVSFAWSWRDPGEAGEAVAENRRHSRARRRRQVADDAPPLVPSSVPGFDPASVDVSGLSPFVRSQLRADRAVMVGGVVVQPGSPEMAALRLALEAEPAEVRAGPCV